MHLASLTGRVIELLKPVFGFWWSYLIIFGGTFAENSVFLGLIMPGETLVALAGFYCVTGVGNLNIWLVLLLATLGAIAGDNAGYWLGRKSGRPLLDRYGKRIKLTEERVAGVERYFRDHGGTTVIIARFTMFLRAFAAFTAGMHRMPYRRFFLADAVGAALWATAYTLLGYFLGYNWESFTRLQDAADYIITAIILAVALVFVLRWRHQRRTVDMGPREYAEVENVE